MYSCLAQEAWMELFKCGTCLWVASSVHLMVLEGELSLHPRLHEVLAGSEDGTVLLWSVDRDVHLSMFFGHASSVTCGDFTPDGKKSVPVLMIHHLEFGTLKPERTFTLLTVIHNIPKV